MFEESEEKFDNALEDFEKVSKKINESYLNKIKEIKENINNLEKYKIASKETKESFLFYVNIDFSSFSTLKKLIEYSRFDTYGSGFELWFRLYGKSNNVEKFNSALDSVINLSEVSDKSFLNQLIKKKEEFDDSFENFNNLFINNCSQTKGSEEIWKKYNDALKDVKDVYTKINELFSFSYYAGYTYYKIGILYKKKRMNNEAYKSFKYASTCLKNASKYGLYKEKGRLWFYKDIAEYEVNKNLGNKSSEHFESLKKAATYGYYDIEIFKKFLHKEPIPCYRNDRAKTNSKNILLLYYLKRYSYIIEKYSNDPSHIKCLDNLITDYGYEGAYYCALSHYEFKEFKKFLEILNKFINIDKVIRSCELLNDQADKNNQRIEEKIYKELSGINSYINESVDALRNENSNAESNLDKIKKSCAELSSNWQNFNNKLSESIIDEVKKFHETVKEIKKSPIFLDKLVSRQSLSIKMILNSCNRLYTTFYC